MNQETCRLFLNKSVSSDPNASHSYDNYYCIFLSGAVYEHSVRKLIKKTHERNVANMASYAISSEFDFGDS
jgi:hypothetical protein